MINELKDKIIALIEKPLNDDGVELVEVKLARYKNDSTLRLFVYSTKGSDVSECARISRLVGDIIEGSDYFSSGYTLEVSSPGLDRLLTTISDFRFRVGEKIRLSFVDKKIKKRTAEIVGVDENTIQFKDSDEEFKVELSEIENGKIIF